MLELFKQIAFLSFNNKFTVFNCFQFDTIIPSTDGSHKGTVHKGRFAHSNMRMRTANNSVRLQSQCSN